MTKKTVPEQRLFVSFTVQRNLYGFDIRIVKEITPAVKITPVPLKQPEVCGVVNIRGQVVVVLDIGVILGGKGREVLDDSQIVILKTAREIEAITDFFLPPADLEAFGTKPVGFLVDAVGDIITAPSSTIEATPSHLGTEQMPFIEGVVRQEKQPFVILNASAILGTAPGA